MTDTGKMPIKDASTVRAKSEDLSQIIVQSVERLAGETIRCTRLYGDHYRCNWWRHDGDDAISSVMGRIVRSRFLRVIKTPDGLVIEDLTAA